MRFKEIFIEALKKYVIPKGIFDYKRELSGDIDLLTRTFIYCLIMRRSEGVDEFLQYGGRSSDYFKMKIAQELNLPDITSEESLLAIRSFLYDRVIKNGYVVHSTNSYYANIIRENGINVSDGLRESSDILGEIESIFPSEFIRTDINYLDSQVKAKSGWFYDRTPAHFKRYSNGPEWFKRLTNGGYTTRDYNASLAFINKIMEYYNATVSDKNSAKRFLDKYWQIFAPTTPHLLLISSKGYDFRPDKEKKIDDVLTLSEQIQYLTESYFRVENQSCEENISKDNIEDIDIKSLLDDYYMHQENGVNPQIR